MQSLIPLYQIGKDPVQLKVNSILSANLWHSSEATKHKTLLNIKKNNEENEALMNIIIIY